MTNNSRTPSGVLPFHAESAGLVQATVEETFAYLDDHARLSGHMSKPSWQMAGGRMTVAFDERGGRGIGAMIRLEGRVLGLRLGVDEVVRDYRPPVGKGWETIGDPRLLVIGAYRMAFEVQPADHAARVRVSIDYDWPSRGAWRLIGRLGAGWYARWCTNRMVRDAVRHFDLAAQGRESPVAA